MSLWRKSKPKPQRTSAYTKPPEPDNPRDEAEPYEVAHDALVADAVVDKAVVDDAAVDAVVGEHVVGEHVVVADSVVEVVGGEHSAVEGVVVPDEPDAGDVVGAESLESPTESSREPLPAAEFPLVVTVTPWVHPKARSAEVAAEDVSAATADEPTAVEPEQDVPEVVGAEPDPVIVARTPNPGSPPIPSPTPYGGRLEDIPEGLGTKF